LQTSTLLKIPAGLSAVDHGRAAEKIARDGLDGLELSCYRGAYGRVWKTDKDSGSSMKRTGCTPGVAIPPAGRPVAHFVEVCGSRRRETGFRAPTKRTGQAGRSRDLRGGGWPAQARERWGVSAVQWPRAPEVITHGEV
jgi:hypothetical protein